ncbi:MAG: hypothetical protein J2P40_15775 [Candidatus Dormibacteraeota bacterium]|nr:hypothetical protein [Candidatus Dormibacteraeota bacterium]MBO0762732.1 hypothetical protein [Candidatus Dormibacteraeota bacterium]
MLPAARAWERVYGWWPKKVVKRAKAVDECDLCRKPIWGTEQVTFLKSEVIADWREDGVLDADPVRPLRVPETNPDVTGWLACAPCAARLFSRLYRLGRQDRE